MNNEVEQANSSQLSPDALAATLAHASNMHEMSLPQAQEEQPADASVAPQDAPGGEMAPEAPKDELKPKEEPKPDQSEVIESKLEVKMLKYLDDIRKELDTKGKERNDSLRKELENALNAQEKE